MEFLLILWPLSIYLSYKFVFLNITQIEKNDKNCRIDDGE